MREDQKKNWVLIGVGIASFLGCLDFTIVNTAIPAIQVSLSASINKLQWIINIFMLSLSATMVVMGKLSDIYGRKKLLYIGMISFTIASFFAGLSRTIDVLIFWRLIQGLSCAIIYTSSGAIVSNAFPLEERPRAMGIFFGIAFAGLAAGPAIGGLLVGLFGWRSVFLVNVPIAIISLFICSFCISESKNNLETDTVDYIGALILIIAISALVLMLTKSAIWGLNSVKTIGFAITTLIMFFILYKFENTKNSPIIDFKLFANSSFLSGVSANFFLAFFYCLDLFLIPLFLHLIRHETAFVIGFMLLSITFFVAITPPLISKLLERKSSYYPCLIGFALFATSAILQTTLSANSSVVTILITFMLTGIAWGSISSPSTVLAMDGLPSSAEGVAMGTSWTLHNLGGIIGLSLGVAVYHFEVGTHSNSFLAGYHSTMYLLLLTSISAFIFLLINFKRSRKLLI